MKSKPSLRKPMPDVPAKTIETKMNSEEHLVKIRCQKKIFSFFWCRGFICLRFCMCIKLKEKEREREREREREKSISLT